MARYSARRLIAGDHLQAHVTPPSVFHARRNLAAVCAAAGLTAAVGSLPSFYATPAQASRAGSGRYVALPGKPSRYSIFENPVPFESATEYNNFYEFGFDKQDPYLRAPGRLRTSPWTVAIEGLVAKPRIMGIDDLRALAPMEERITRLRCVEGWSMVIPWVGYSLAELIRRVQPLGSAKFVEFTTLADPVQMPGLASRALRWPYREGLRLDEANHPLTLLTFGMYGVTLPEQNGAPIRLVVPWKYGFKSIKSIVKIRFVETQPDTLWTLSAPSEYGFYANVNPEVNHPRWSQATERVLGTERLFTPRRKTDMFNGYAELVAGMYAGMNLHKHY